MLFKTVAVAVLLSVCHAAEKSEQNHEKHHIATSSNYIHREDVLSHPPKDWIQEDPNKYEFEYKVNDPHTGDHKHQHEAGDGHAVKGVYSLHEADGSIRTVHYVADKHKGFLADVQHSKHEEEQEEH